MVPYETSVEGEPQEVQIFIGYESEYRGTFETRYITDVLE